MSARRSWLSGVIAMGVFAFTASCSSQGTPATGQGGAGGSGGAGGVGGASGAGGGAGHAGLLPPGTPYACMGSPGFGGSGSGDAGSPDAMTDGSTDAGAGGASHSDTCIVGQTYCQMTRFRNGATEGSCRPLGNCASNPTCACALPRPLVNCSCADFHLTVTCDQI